MSEKISGLQEQKKQMLLVGCQFRDQINNGDTETMFTLAVKTKFSFSFKVFAGILTALMLIFNTSCNSQAQDEGPDIVAEPIEAILAAELWTITSQNSYVSKSGAVISVWRIDSEGFPPRGDLRLFGIVAAGLGDLGEVPVAFKVWARPDIQVMDALSSNSSSGSQEAQLFLGPIDSPCIDKTSSDCLGDLWNLSLSPDGKVLVNDEERGIVR